MDSPIAAQILALVHAKQLPAAAHLKAQWLADIDKVLRKLRLAVEPAALLEPGFRLDPQVHAIVTRKPPTTCASTSKAP